MDVRKKFLQYKWWRQHWHRLSRKVVTAPTLETFKVRLGWARLCA